MKLKSKYFDIIRIKSGSRDVKPETPDHPICHWKGCEKPGLYRAPKGRDKEGEFYLFCSEHIRQFNASYNYFDGMSDVEIKNFKEDATYGHRPTWKTGASAYVNEGRDSTRPRQEENITEGKTKNAHGFQEWRIRRDQKMQGSQRKLKTLEKKAMIKLGLSEHATKSEVKARFKSLVKRHHPDLNGGDRGTEEKLRDIIQAYNYLKKVGLV
ncbi:MAG: Chaperone protein DnaJ [Hyphomicrobiaceae bacterium hypho_1]